MKFSFKNLKRPHKKVRLGLDGRLSITWRHSVYLTIILVSAIVVANYLLYISLANKVAGELPASTNPSVKSEDLAKLVDEIKAKAITHESLLITEPAVTDLN